MLTQPEQLLRHRVEQIYETGDLHRLLAELSSHEQSDFPPLYDPPPKPYVDGSWPLLEIVEIIADEPPANWVRAKYLEKFARTLHNPFSFDESKWERVVTVLGRLPEGRALIEEVQRDEFGYSSGLGRYLESAKKKAKEETEQKVEPPK
jgi:hypothetical protein